MNPKSLLPRGRFAAAAGVFLLVLSAVAGAAAEELPRPSLQNTVYISIEHSPTDSASVNYILANIPFGLYAQPSFSVTHIDPDLPWHTAWTAAASGIAEFEEKVDALLQAAQARGVKLHLVVCSGLARGLQIYAEAKTEDIRNCQWYNDNNLGTAEQTASPEAMSLHIFGTLSRYARKMRANLEAKSQAAFAFLKQRMDLYPETFLAVSGWGEAELSFKRIDQSRAYQTFFCDYSPFAVLEFRDWITHQGMYDDANGIYKGEGYVSGGAVYQGAAGLAEFNADFGTAFTVWDLKYYHWSLADPWDQNPADQANNDPGRIPLASYVQDGMMPGSGPKVIAGGFDPPRIMDPKKVFYRLWNEFRVEMVRHFVRDAARWAHEAGIPAEKWYSHQIPADYLFSTRPALSRLNPRYYSSASPLSTADIAPYGSVGATIYDVKFADKTYRTTAYILPDISAMSPCWAALEYDPETYPQGLDVPETPADDIYAQYLKIYRYGPTLINFWRWKDGTGEHQIQGTTKEDALVKFVSLIRNTAKTPDYTRDYTPPVVSGAYAVRESAYSSTATLTIPDKIWPDEKYAWKEWGYFYRFEIHRYLTRDQPESEGVLVAKSAVYTLNNVVAGILIPSFRPKMIPYYFRVRAVNKYGTAGPWSDVFKAEIAE